MIWAREVTLPGQSEPPALLSDMDREGKTNSTVPGLHLQQAACTGRGCVPCPQVFITSIRGNKGVSSAPISAEFKKKAKHHRSLKFPNRMVAANPVSPKPVSNLKISTFYAIYVQLGNWLSPLRATQGRRYDILVTNLKYLHFSWAVEGKVLRSLLMKTVAHHHWPLCEYAFLWSLNQNYCSYQKK